MDAIACHAVGARTNAASMNPIMLLRRSRSGAVAKSDGRITATGASAALHHHHIGISIADDPTVAIPIEATINAAEPVVPRINRRLIAEAIAMSTRSTPTDPIIAASGDGDDALATSMSVNAESAHDNAVEIDPLAVRDRIEIASVAIPPTHAMAHRVAIESAV